MSASSCLPSGCFPQPRWAVVGALSVAVPGQGCWHRILAQHSRGCCWSGKCCSSTGPCPWIHRDPPSQVKSISLHGQPHNAGFMCFLCSWGLSESLAGASECFQKLPAALPRGDSSVPTSWLAPTWRYSSTISPPADQAFLKFICLFKPTSQAWGTLGADVNPTFSHPSTAAPSLL